VQNPRVYVKQQPTKTSKTVGKEENEKGIRKGETIRHRNAIVDISYEWYK
jgi:hypothetical protein